MLVLPGLTIGFTLYDLSRREKWNVSEEFQILRQDKAFRLSTFFHEIWGITCPDPVNGVMWGSEVLGSGAPLRYPLRYSAVLRYAAVVLH